MSVFFLTCLALGGAVLVIQLLLGVMGFDHGHGHDLGDAAHAKDALHAHHHEGAQGLNLLSARALSAGVAFFGVGGLAGLATGWGWVVGVVLGLVTGLTAAVGVAAAMRSMLQMESDGTVSIHGAVGTTGTVYLSIPGGEGAGKIHLNLQNRMVELQATSEKALPTGASVLVVDVVGPDTVSVVPNPISDEVRNVVS